MTRIYPTMFLMINKYAGDRRGLGASCAEEEGP